ncbi:hypothetical protein SK128_028077, partial [Halocaridina rubra]
VLGSIIYQHNKTDLEPLMTSVVFCPMTEKSQNQKYLCDRQLTESEVLSDRTRNACDRQ